MFVNSYMEDTNKHKIMYDEIGYWSEIKLDIIREYAYAYSQILSSQTIPHFIIFILMPFLALE